MYIPTTYLYTALLPALYGFNFVGMFTPWAMCSQFISIVILTGVYLIIILMLIIDFILIFGR